MSKSYAILGAGMQGAAVAYDLAKYAHASAIALGDASLEQAQATANRVNNLVGSAICSGSAVDALHPGSLFEFLAPHDVVASCVPYWMHPHIAPVAIESRTCMVDMGGDTRVARKTLGFDEAAKEGGVVVIPDTGLAPGLVNNLGAYLIESFDKPDSVHLYCGGLPRHPKPPFNYKLVFNIEGLVTEYMDQADVLRNNQLVAVDTLQEVETIHVDGLGEMEAFVTSGGVSTAPETFQGRVSTYDYKTIRFPGHAHLMRIFRDFGFWSNDKIVVRSGEAAPRDIFCTLMSPMLKDPDDTDQVIVRAIGEGTQGGRRLQIQLDIHQLANSETGYSAMEQLTGFSTSIYAMKAGSGTLSPGCHRYETAMTGHEFVTEIRKRGIEIRETITS